MTFKIDTDDDIPLNKVLKFDYFTFKIFKTFRILLLKSVIEQDFDYYPQI